MISRTTCLSVYEMSMLFILGRKAHHGKQGDETKHFLHRSK